MAEASTSSSVLSSAPMSPTSTTDATVVPIEETPEANVVESAEDAKSNAEEDEEEEEEGEGKEPHPSIRAGEALIDSYTFHSVDSLPLALSSSIDLKGKRKADVLEEEELKVPEGEWMIGVDEAGRGPVLGPQVYGIAFCQVKYSDELKELGFADSKTLTAQRRDALLDVMNDHADQVKWAVTVMSPHDLSKGMLRKNPYNLNAQSHDTTIALIKSVLDRDYKVTECYVDTVGIAADYQKKLESLFPTISFVVTSKADAIYPIVSAASIAAKVTRDRVLENWKFAEGNWGGEEGQREFGSGYPGDPKTIAWLENNVDPVFGYPSIARFSWQTVKTILLKRAHKVKWTDEPGTIQKYFSTVVENTKLPLWQDFALASVDSF